MSLIPTQTRITTMTKTMKIQSPLLYPNIVPLYPESSARAVWASA